MMQWRRHNRADSSQGILVPSYGKHEPYNRQQKLTSNHLAMWIGAVSQAAMLLVVLFGYIYTVRPVFQHQLLQERLASAELERLEIEDQIRVLEDERDTAEANLIELQTQIESVREGRQFLEDELQKAILRAQHAQSEANRLDQVVEDQLDELESARWELLMLDFSFARLMLGRDGLLSGWNEGESSPEYLQRYKEEWPDPHAILLNSIEDLRERNIQEPRYPDSYIDEFRNFIDSRKDELICSTPQFDDLKIQFEKRTAEIEGVVEEKTSEYLDNLVSEYQERRERVRITEDFRDSIDRMHRVSEEVEIGRDIKSKVREYLDDCRAVAGSVVEEFRELKEVTR